MKSVEDMPNSASSSGSVNKMGDCLRCGAISNKRWCPGCGVHHGINLSKKDIELAGGNPSISYVLGGRWYKTEKQRIEAELRQQGERGV